MQIHLIVKVMQSWGCERWETRLLSTAVTIQNFWILIFRYTTAGAPSGQASRNTTTSTGGGTEQVDSIGEDSGYPSRAQDGNGARDQSE